MVTNWVAKNNRNISSHSSRDPKSELQVLAEPHNLWRLQTKSVPCLFQILMAADIPLLVATSWSVFTPSHLQCVCLKLSSVSPI